MLKQGIVLGLVCLANHAYSASITVTTTEDISGGNQCSLRNAIEYVNQGMPEQPLHGCGGKDAQNTILLQANTEYKLNQQIKISKNLIIRSLYSSGLNENVLGKNNAQISMNGKGRLFWIERAAAEVPKDGEEAVKPSPILVTFSELTLRGCKQAACVDKGGLIYNLENIVIQYSQLLGGHAQKGGAIYNAGKWLEGEALSSSLISDSLLKDNHAAEGAVIYSELPQFLLLRSVIRDNSVSQADAAVLDIQQPFNQEQLTQIGEGFVRGITSSSIFNNSGYVAKVYDGMSVNNITMLGNSKGLIFNAPFKRANLANSILAQNGDQDCRVIAGGDPEKISNNLYGQGCAGQASQQLGQTRLIAGGDLEGKCDRSSDGILCPFTEDETTLLGYFKPRLLGSYKQLSDSPIVNRGPSAGSQLMACSREGDQRGKPHPSMPELCDRGAIELHVDPSAISQVGEDLLYGQVAKMTLTEQLLDGELLPAQECKALFGDRPDAQPWQPGCMKVVQTGTVSKGMTTIDAEGELTYVPNGDWHGLDEFKVLIVTTTTRFSDSRNPYIEVPVRVVQSPPNDFENKKTKTSGGSIGGFGVLALLGLWGIRRYLK